MPLADLTRVSNAKNEFEMLGIPDSEVDSISIADIRRAFREIAKKVHPDQNKDNRKQAEEAFKRVVSAYEKLSDSRTLHDIQSLRRQSGVTMGTDYDEQVNAMKPPKPRAPPPSSSPPPQPRAPPPPRATRKPTHNNMEDIFGPPRESFYDPYKNHGFTAPPDQTYDDDYFNPRLSAKELREMNKLNQQLEEERAEKHRLELELGIKRADITKLHNDVKAIESTLNDTKRELRAAKKDISTLSAKNQQLSSTNLSQKQELKDIAKTRDSLRNQLEECTEETQQLRIKLHEAQYPDTEKYDDDELPTLKDKLSEANQKLIEKTKENEKLQQQITALQIEQQNARNAVVEDESAAITQIQDELDAARQRIDTLEEEVFVVTQLHKQQVEQVHEQSVFINNAPNEVSLSEALTIATKRAIQGQPTLISPDRLDEFLKRINSVDADNELKQFDWVSLSKNIRFITTQDALLNLLNVV
jgi:curved DNA-binding protein CbpA